MHVGREVKINTVTIYNNSYNSFSGTVLWLVLEYRLHFNLM